MHKHTGSITSDSSRPTIQSSPRKHLYHNLYSSPSKKDFQKFIPPLNNNQENIDASLIQPLFDNRNVDNSVYAEKSMVNATNPNLYTSPSKKPTVIKKPKICKVCSKQIIGTLVRAMGNIYHIDCFTCYDCHKPCSDKFFAADIEVMDNKTNEKHTINVPLCEYDYFKRIDLICHTCNSAIRGSYITALGHKYHSEHFFCDVCHKVFESDNYYANEGKIYCHFHYSKLYAYHCQGCKCAILKQYVEINRGGKQQQWHPECFMTHKFWKVDINVDAIGLGVDTIDDVTSDPEQLYKVSTTLENLTISIWTTLSEFEESCASLISEMLHAATTNSKSKGLSFTSKLIFKIYCLFKCLDCLSSFSSTYNISIDHSLPKYQGFSKLTKEPRSLTSKLMSYLTFLRDIDPEKLSMNKYSQELLSLISSIAHFIKLISRNALMYSLEYNRLSNSMKPTEILLNEIANHEKYKKDLFHVSSKSNDTCSHCHQSIEDDCILYKIDESNEKRWHLNCFVCSKCSGNTVISITDVSEAAYNRKTGAVLCPSCASDDVNSATGFTVVTRFIQLAYLLEIALFRSKVVINKRVKSGHSKQHSSVSATTTPTSFSDNSRKPSDASNKHSILRKSSHSRQDRESIKREQQQQSEQHQIPKNDSTDSYENNVSEIARRRSLREARTLNNVDQEIRKSVILEAPIAWSADTENIPEPSAASDKYQPKNEAEKVEKMVSNSQSRVGTTGSMKLRVKDLSIKKRAFQNRQQPVSSYDYRENNHHTKSPSDDKIGASINAAITSKLLQNESSLTLDDIPRIVSSEQAREHRPNAFKFQKRDYSSAISNMPVPKTIETTSNNQLEISERKDSKQTPTHRPKLSINDIEDSAEKKPVNNVVRYSELSYNAHEIIRHIAAIALYEIFPNQVTIEYCTTLIDVHKAPSFWGKIFGGGGNSSSIHSSSPSTSSNDFKSGSATISGSGKGVFGVPLDAVVKKFGTDSDLGVGTRKVRIPLLVDELINVMRKQDVSTEGVFRLNGNIKRLRQLVEEIDSHPDRTPKLDAETPIQLAALLKKYLRDLPVPLLTFKLYDLFLLSQKLGSDPDSSDDDAIARKRERVLKLAYAMLPKPNRDLAEVLFAFLSWVATFAEIGDEDNGGGGSKMDTHNLATVITPNILYSNESIHRSQSEAINDGFKLINSEGGENQFLAIEVINDMIEMNEELSIVPQDIVELYKLAGFDRKLDEKDKKNSLITKDILAKLKQVIETNPTVLTK